jgi:hypothetical protein
VRHGVFVGWFVENKVGCKWVQRMMAIVVMTKRIGKRTIRFNL